MNTVKKNISVNLHTAVAIVLLAWVGLACSKKEAEQATKEIATTEADVVQLTVNQQKTADIKVGHVEERNISASVKVSGKLEAPPQNLVTISAPFAGFIQQTDLLQGMEVKKGQVVATMQHPDYIQLQQDYLDTKSQLEFLQAEYTRQQELAKDNINSAKTVQLARSNFLSAQAKAQGYKAKLQLMNVDLAAVERGEFSSTINLRSPIDGFVTEIQVNIGQFVNPNDVIFKIVNTHHLHVELKIFEKDVFKVKKGQTILFTLSGDNVQRKATVYLIGRDIGNDRSITVHGHLNDENNNFLPGMYLTGEIEINPIKVTALPESAIVSHEGNAYIFIEEKSGQYRMISVKIGVTEEGYTQVDMPEGVDQKANIVVNGAYSLLSVLKKGSAED